MQMTRKLELAIAHVDFIATDDENHDYALFSLDKLQEHLTAARAAAVERAAAKAAEAAETPAA